MAEVRTPLQGTVVHVKVDVGALVDATTPVAVVESMKLEHVVEAGTPGTVTRLLVASGDQVQPGDPLAEIAPAPVAVPPAGPVTVPGATGSPVGPTVSTSSSGDVPDETVGVGPAPDAGRQALSSDLVHGGHVDAAIGSFGTGAAGAADRGPLRADLAEVVRRHEIGLDAARPEAVAKRHERGQRTARENVTDLCDPGSFVEYGPLVVAAQRRRRDEQELIERTPADGLVAGVGTVDGRPTAVLSYDYTVLAGTQGVQNHRKKDRLFEVVERRRLPVVFFAEGGGGRPGDTDALGVSGLDVPAFELWARLSGLVPRVGVVSGRCFAGNALILGCCDVVIATEGSNVGMGGPAMIEGGGLGVVAPEDIGPLDVQVANGVVDVPVADEAEAVQVARRYLSYFSHFAGPAERAESGSGDRDASDGGGWDCVDQATLRDLIPENRRQAYDVRAVVEALADTGSVLELRPGFGRGMVTALARVEGRPLGIVANNPLHLAGAIDADGADKAARFMQLCDAFDLPLLLLCDTPGIMVGPEAEEAALVRHASRLVTIGANLSVPFGTIVLRKAYGLGAQAMAGGSFKAPLFCVSWPTGELGGMGLEGAVRLGFRRELDAIDDPAERERVFEQMVAAAYEHGRALNAASYFELDDVIDPAASRQWISTAFANPPSESTRGVKKRPYIDTW